jgi:hypothetical protein
MVAITIATTMEEGRGSLALTIGIQNGARIERGVGVTWIAGITTKTMRRMRLLGIGGSDAEVE